MKHAQPFDPSGKGGGLLDMVPDQAPLECSVALLS